VASILCPRCATRYRVSIGEASEKKCPGCGKTLEEIASQVVKDLNQTCELNSDRITIEDFIKLAQR